MSRTYPGAAIAPLGESRVAGLGLARGTGERLRGIFDWRPGLWRTSRGSEAVEKVGGREGGREGKREGESVSLRCRKTVNTRSREEGRKKGKEGRREGLSRRTWTQ